MTGGGVGGGGAGGLGGTGGTTGGTGGTTGGVGGATGGASGAAGMTGGTGVVTGGMGGTAGGGSGGMTGGMGGMTGGAGGDAGMEPDGGGGMMGTGECCDDGNCLCHTEPPADHTLEDGPFTTDYYDLSGVGCVYYPDDATAEPPFAAIAISDGFTGTGGCGSFMTGGWGPFLASYGIVVLNVEVPSCCVPERGDALTAGIQALKDENADSGSALFGKLAGRYGVAGFSMGGGGSTLAAGDDPTLLTSIPIMSHQPISDVMVPTLFTCGSSDSGTFGGCGVHGMPAYSRMPAGVPKGIFTVNSGHAGQPTSGGQGQYVLPFQKYYLEGDERWRDLVLSIPFDASENIE